MTAIATQALVWFVAIGVCVVLVWRRYPEVFKPRASSPGAIPTTGERIVSGPILRPVARSLIHWYPITFIVVVFVLISATAPKLLVVPNIAWVPLILWALVILLSQARSFSRKSDTSSGKDKKPHPKLVLLSDIVHSLAVLSTIAAVVYFVWNREEWRSIVTFVPRDEMIIAKGVPREPNPTSRELESWRVEYISTNPHFKVPQAGLSGKSLRFAPEPRREVTDAANLVISFGETYRELDILIEGTPGSCMYVKHERTSKTCVGAWRDRGGKISGFYYLEFDVWGNAFQVDLWGPHSLPERNSLGLVLSRPIPHAQLRAFAK